MREADVRERHTRARKKRSENVHESIVSRERGRARAEEREGETETRVDR